ncbi:hypothetical protein CC86DRAFT_367620 [Ophiobolus disseminans]|uniref:Ribosomal protein/NADH dehydrogenase domain-containing protein n=1 Tax=Ophiobolus disseminans TaxID=1469910 RepID=A0A6A7A921_9PLEO|nr:hypothetical protein CC86DRAFT_367620 [Ophiobolus disseminans]
MEFNTKLHGGHRGARKFWRHMLPRMKFRNPAVSMTVNRHTDPDGPSLLHIYTKFTAAQQAAPPSATPNAQTTLVPDTSKPAHTLNIKDQDESEILDALVKAIGATQIEPTEQEKQEMAELEDFKERSEVDRVLVREKLLKERREQELLKMARGEMAVAN